MSVRDGLLAILSLGPAYGLQLHSELRSRAAHRAPVNVGQIYSTIDRLTRDGLIMPAGTTADSLPLHGLTESGRAAALEWMSTASIDSGLEWTGMLDQLLVTSTIDRAAAHRLAAEFRRMWAGELEDAGRMLRAGEPRGAGSTSADRLALLARQAHAVAILAWLSSFVDEIVESDTVLPYSPIRPKRGRRPRESVPA